MGKQRIEQRLAQRGGWVECLRAPALAYRGVTSARNWAYDRGLLRTQRVEAPVVSVGNLSVGGTGKTPMVIYLARKLLQQGRRPGLLSRGYGATTGDEQNARPDEAELLVRALPDVPHVMDKDRVRGARELVRRGLDVILLDDGFQHRRLVRDLDLVLLDTTSPWGLPAPDDDPKAAGRPVSDLLPRGLLRESPAGLKRAHAIVLTRCDQSTEEERARIRSRLASIVPGLALIEASHRCVAVTDPDGWRLSPDALSGLEVDLISGIGQPAAFERTVASTGARIGEHRRFPDHHAFQKSDLEGFSEDRALITTSKDAVKLARFGRKLWVIEVEMALESGAQVLDALLEALPESHDQIRRRSIHEGLHG